MRNGFRHGGFSLVEILVVTTILAILCALLMPAMASAREAGRGAACQEHLKQVAMATLMYAMDWNERLPTHFRVEQGYIGIDIFSMLLPYHKDWRIFQCPSVPGHWTIRGYGYNHVYLNYQLLSRINHTSDTIMFCDNKRRSTDGASVAHCFPPGYPGANNGPDPRHNRMANFAFVDGHVKRMEPWQTINPLNLWDIQ